MTKLIDRLRQVEDQAIEELYQEVFEKFWLYVRSRGGSMDDARDVFQDEIVHLLEAVHKRDIENVKGYFFRMLTNKWNKSQRGAKIVSMDQQPDLTRKLDATESLQQVKEAEWHQQKEEKLAIVDQLLETAKPDEKKILLDFYFHKKSLGVIAQEMGLTNSYLRVKKTRMMERFRSRLAGLL